MMGEVRRVRFEDVMARSTCQSVTHVNRYVISFSLFPSFFSFKINDIEPFSLPVEVHFRKK